MRYYFEEYLTLCIPDSGRGGTCEVGLHLLSAVSHSSPGPVMGHRPVEAPAASPMT